MKNNVSDMQPYEFFDLMIQNDVMLVYQGGFNQDMIKSVLSMTEKKLAMENVQELVRKKLFNIMVECLQNICKHQIMLENVHENPMFIISQDGEFFHITTGNLIVSDKVDLVTDRINKVNSMNQEELKEYYKKARLNSVISNVGGAGLGFIDIARKSGNKIDFRFYPVNDNVQYFLQSMKINK